MELDLELSATPRERCPQDVSISASLSLSALHPARSLTTLPTTPQRPLANSSVVASGAPSDTHATAAPILQRHAEKLRWNKALEHLLQLADLVPQKCPASSRAFETFEVNGPVAAVHRTRGILAVLDGDARAIQHFQLACQSDSRFVSTLCVAIALYIFEPTSDAAEQYVFSLGRGLNELCFRVFETPRGDTSESESREIAELFRYIDSIQYGAPALDPFPCAKLREEDTRLRFLLNLVTTVTSGWPLAAFFADYAALLCHEQQKVTEAKQFLQMGNFLRALGCFRLGRWQNTLRWCCDLNASDWASFSPDMQMELDLVHGLAAFALGDTAVALSFLKSTLTANLEHFGSFPRVLGKRLQAVRTLGLLNDFADVNQVLKWVKRYR
jgi:hypothetical protein